MFIDQKNLNQRMCSKMRKLTPLFSVPILQTEITLTKKLNESIDKQERKLIEPAKNGLMSTDTYVLDNEDFNETKKQILKEIEYYKNNILCVRKDIDLYIKNSWIMFHESNHFSNSHYHLNSFLSGILYIKTPSNSGDIVFHNPSMNSSVLPLLNVPFEKYNQYNSSTWTIPLKEGKLLLFPSSLLHSVTSNISFDTRISLAFNVLIKGDLSQDERSHFNL